MKNLLLIVLLALGSFAAKAQEPNMFYNGGRCPLQIRTICIDETTCTHIPEGLGTWTNLPPSGIMAAIPMPIPNCTVAGYEIRYDPSTGCSGTVFYTTHVAGPCSNYEDAAYFLPPCDYCCPSGVNIQFDPSHPSFRAHCN